MSLEEMRQSILQETNNHRLTPNSEEYLAKWRTIARADYNFEDLPQLARLECGWKAIVSQHPFAYLVGSRETVTYGDPLSMFMGYVASGYYPPPEVMLSLLICFEFYYRRGGQKSLDEIFFGKPYGKKTNDAFLHGQNSKFIGFKIFHEQRIAKLEPNASPSTKSVTESLRQYTMNNEYDVTETTMAAFLKGYKRWLNKHKK